MSHRIFPLLKFIRDRRFRALSVYSLAFMVAGGLFYHLVEGWRLLDSFYFAIITLTTVGYGDFSPQTDPGKIFTIFYVLAGIGIIFGFINALYEFRKEGYLERKDPANKR